MLYVPCFMLYALCFLLNALCFMRFMMVAFWSIFDRFLKLYAWGQPCLTGIWDLGPTWCPTWGLRALKIQFLTNLAPTWGPTWGPKILLYVTKNSQEASGSDPGALLKGVENGPQHRRHSRSIFYRFWDHLGGPGLLKIVFSYHSGTDFTIFGLLNIKSNLSHQKHRFWLRFGGQVEHQNQTSWL